LELPCGVCENQKVRPSSDSLPLPLLPNLATLKGLLSSLSPAMSTPHVIASSSGHHSVSTNNGIVGGHYKVGKKIGEGSFGVVFEGMSLFPYSYYAHFVVVRDGRPVKQRAWQGSRPAFFSPLFITWLALNS